MKTYLLLGTSLLAALVGCNRSGIVDGTGSGGVAASSASSSAGAVAKSSTPARIAHGQTVNIQDYVVPGKTTIFDFTSEYCPPCRAIAPKLHQLHANRADIVVVEVDINRPGIQGIDWGSPVAQQYGMQSIPHFKIYGPNGQLQAEGESASSIVYGMVR